MLGAHDFDGQWQLGARPKAELWSKAKYFDVPKIFWHGISGQKMFNHSRAYIYSYIALDSCQNI